MDKTTLGVIAAIGALAATPAAAHATANATAAILQPRTVAELLDLIPQPVETLAKLDAERVQVADAELHLGPLGVDIGRRHHHHHHHHYYRRHHHHYHHHYNNY